MIRALFKKTAKWLLIFLLLVLLILAVAYWTAPRWVPTQVQQLLPPELKITNLKLQRPGLAQAFVEELEITLVGEQQLNAQLKNITLHYSLAQKKLTRIEAKNAVLELQESSSPPNNTFSNAINIPHLPIEQLNFEQASVSGLFVQELFFENLNIEQQNDALQLDTQVEFIGLEFDLLAKINSNNNLLHNLKAQIKQQQDTIHLELSPANNSTTAFDWELAATLDSRNYYPIDGLSTIALEGNGALDLKESLLLQLDKDFMLSAPFDLKQLKLKAELAEQLANKGISLDLAQLEDALTLKLHTTEITNVLWHSDQYQLELTQGSLPFLMQHPLLNTQLTLEQLQLYASLPLSAPEQRLAGNLKADTLLKHLAVKQASSHISSDKLALNLDSSFVIENASLKLAAEQIKLNMGTTQIKDLELQVTAAATQWNGHGEVQQSLVGEDKNNHQLLILKQRNTIDLPIIIQGLTTTIGQLNNQVTLTKDKLTLDSNIGQVAQDNLLINDIAATSNLNLNNDKLNGSIRFKNASFNNDQVAVNNANGKLSWLKSRNHIFSKGQLNYQDEAIPFRYQINFDNDKQQLTLSPLHISATSISQWLSPLLTKYPNLSITAGQISSEKIKGYPITLAFEGALTADNVNLAYDQLSVVNLQLDEQLDPKAPVTGTAQGRVQKIEVAAGIDITDLQFFMQHSADAYQLQDVFAYLLKGNLYIPQLTLSEKGIAPFNVKLDKIDLGQLLKALESEALDIQGRFDLLLPIKISDKGPSIVDGSFKSNAAGIIKVNTGASAQTNIAFQALQNFHYQELSGVINYSESEIYRLKIFLKGANPDLYDGFPIELTLNVEGNLPNLLYSMLVSGDMTKPIIDKYKAGELELPESVEQP
ncbi:YdbH domain-containing protein [Kangiella sp. TOML190]|uniref:intermembrane phospholipid transport protein YdbH family protein n=1 Tax=Kangiella sp. TOML190 TaxID=2931351 RepID=UPI00203D79BB|nr:YdbH domain-containing protein [Kangiella sp. TOML190]